MAKKKKPAKKKAARKARPGAKAGGALDSGTGDCIKQCIADHDACMARAQTPQDREMCAQQLRTCVGRCVTGGGGGTPGTNP